MSRLLASRDGFGEAIFSCAKDNSNLMVLSADLSDSLKLAKLKTELPNQYLELGISEQNMAGVAAGLALTGKKVFLTSFAVFNPGRNWEQLRLSISEQNLDVVVVGSHAGLATGADGGTHQALEDLALAALLPHFKVAVPADYYQAKAMTHFLATHRGPAYLRLSRERSMCLTSPDQEFSWGKGQLLCFGEQGLIVACGLTVELALEAARQLAMQGIKVSVFNCASFKPLPERQLLSLAERVPVVITIEEHQLTFGLGSAVASLLSRHHPLPMAMLGIDDQFGQSGSKDELFAHYHLTVEHLKTQVQNLLGGLSSKKKLS